MQNKSVRPPGWFGLHTYLQLLYKADCIDNPTAKREKRYWYDSQGRSTGVEAGGNPPQERPANGAYSTTKTVGDVCLRDAHENPSMCALLYDLEYTCAYNGEQYTSAEGRVRRDMCKMLLTTGEGQNPERGEALPPFAVGLEGGPFELDAACSGVLTQLGNNPDIYDEGSSVRESLRETMQSHCPDFLAALERRTGASSGRDPGRFWPALGELIVSGFAPPGKNPVSIGDISADPNFQLMCGQAKGIRDKCEVNLNNIRSHDTTDTGTVGQAGAFNTCVNLYSQVLSMCEGTNLWAAKVVARLQPNPARAPQSGPAARPSPNGTGQSAPPPGQPQFSEECVDLAERYVEAAEDRDKSAAAEVYRAMNKSCPELIAKATPPFPQRRMGDRTRDTFGGCFDQPERCAAARPSRSAGIEGPPDDFLDNMIGILGAMQGVLGAAQALQGRRIPTMSGGSGGTDMSTINRRARSTYGNGTPTPAPRTRPSDITGTGR